MAVTAFTKGYHMDAVNDVLNQATCGNANHTGRFVCRVNSIGIVSGATGGAVTVRIHGTGGDIIFAITAATTDTAMLTFSTPQDLGDIAVTALPATCAVLVYTQ